MDTHNTITRLYLFHGSLAYLNWSLLGLVVWKVREYLEGPETLCKYNERRRVVVDGHCVLLSTLSLSQLFTELPTLAPL